MFWPIFFLKWSTAMGRLRRDDPELAASSLTLRMLKCQHLLLNLVLASLQSLCNLPDAQGGVAGMRCTDFLEVMIRSARWFTGRQLVLVLQVLVSMFRETFQAVVSTSRETLQEAIVAECSKALDLAPHPEGEVARERAVWRAAVAIARRESWDDAPTLVDEPSHHMVPSPSPTSSAATPAPFVSPSLVCPHLCVACTENSFDQMPFRCQHIVLCHGVWDTRAH
jgi:hypothetical protein